MKNVLFSVFSSQTIKTPLFVSVPDFSLEMEVLNLTENELLISSFSIIKMQEYL